MNRSCVRARHGSDPLLHAADWLGRSVRVVVDRPIGYLHKNTVYPINYGYIPGVYAGDGEELDAYILGISEPLESFEGVVIGVILRQDDLEDKLVVAEAGQPFHQAQIAEAVQFMEQHFSHRIESVYRKSCGVIPYRYTRGQKEFLIVLQRNSCWSFPKGHMEAGETEEQTALRELYEETGLTAQLDNRRRASIEYPISDVSRKQVVFFSGEVFGTPIIRENEIDRFKWVSADELKDYLYPDTVAACRELLR